MKKIIITLLIISNFVYAQNNINSEELNNRNIVESSMFMNMEVSRRNKLKSLLTKESDYFSNLIRTTPSEDRNLFSDPNVLKEVIDAKDELNDKAYFIDHLAEYQQFISKNAAIEAEFPVASIDVSGGSKLFAVQYIAYKEIETDLGPRYLGYGLYMIIKANSFESSSSLSLPYLAASATMSNNNFTYSTQLLGFKGVNAHKLLKSVMPGSTFGIDTYVGYEKFKDLLIEGLENGEVEICPVFIDPMFVIGELDADNIALIKVYALISVAKRIELGKVLSGSNDQSENAQLIIKQVYKKHASITKSNQKPSSGASSQAKTKLKSIGIDIK